MGRVRLKKGSGQYEPLPEGTYDLKIVEVEQGVSKNQNPQLRVGMEVLDGPHSGKKISAWYSLLDQSLWNLYNLCDALYIEMEDTGEVDDAGEPVYDFDDDTLVGCCVRFNVGIREYNGKKNNTFNDPALSHLDPQHAKLTAEGGADATQTQAEPVKTEAAPAAAPSQTPAPAARRRRPTA